MRHPLLGSTEPGAGSGERQSEGERGLDRVWWGQALMGSVGSWRLAVFPTHLLFSMQPLPLPPRLHHFSHFISLLWFVSRGRFPELFLRSEKGSAVCWQQALVPVAGTQPAPTVSWG